MWESKGKKGGKGGEAEGNLVLSTSETLVP